MTLKDTLEQKGLYEPNSILFLLGIKYQDLHPEMLDYLATLPNADLLSSIFVTTESGKPRLNANIFNEGEFGVYLSLLKERNIGPNGYEFNKASYGLKLSSKEARNAFNMLILTHEVDLVALADHTLEFYAGVKYIPKLETFLTDIAPAYFV